MKNIFAIITVFFLGSTYFDKPHTINAATSADTPLEYLVGNWKSTGFVTDVRGKQQLIEMTQNITNDNKAVAGVKFESAGFNPSNKFKYTASKSMYYDNSTNSWHVKGTVGGKYTLDNKVYIALDNAITYTFYDDSKNLMRYTFEREDENTFTETEQIWTPEGWEKTAWFRSKRIGKDNTVAHTQSH